MADTDAIFAKAATRMVMGFRLQCRLSIIQVLGDVGIAHFDTGRFSLNTDDVALEGAIQMMAVIS